MSTYTKFKIALTKDEKRSLRSQKLRIAELSKCDVLELEEILEVSYERARDLFALIQFQIIPSIGIRFAEDLVSMNLYSLEDLKGKDGAKLFEAYEKQQGCWIDSCVEDQFRLAVNYADRGDTSKKW